jgi:acetyl esterase/lipase
VVAIPGGPQAPGARAGLGPFAQLAAGQGAVVFVADYREGPQWGGGWTNSYQDVACAIRFARGHASQYGGDGSRITLVAHSFGNFIAAGVALSPNPFTPAPGSCLATTGSTKPDAYVGVAGLYSQASLTPDFLDAFLGGTSSQDPGAWEQSDPMTLAAGNSGPRIPIRLIAGTADVNAPLANANALLAPLQASGHDATLTTLDADHNSILQDFHTIQVVLETATGLR